MGLCAAIISDVFFVALVPAFLDDLQFSRSEIVIVMSVHFGSDLAGRIIYSLVNVCYRTRNRNIFYIGAVVTVIFRISAYLFLKN